MDQAARIVTAIKQGGINKVVVIDDAFDPPAVGHEDAGPLLDLLTKDEHAWARKRSKVSDEEATAAADALMRTEYSEEALVGVVAKLYARFVEKFDKRFDPAGRFDVLKGSNLSYVRPLLKLLGQCPGLSVIRIGSNDQTAELAGDDAQVVFIDYYLDRRFTPESDPDGIEGTEARGASLRALRAVLDAQPGVGPSVMLMSSHAVAGRADDFRREVRDAKRSIFASRFAYMAKDDLKEDDGGKIDVEPAAAEALLDMAQRHLFAGAVEDALTHWKDGVDAAIESVWQTITELELKDFAYLSRFRLAEEGQPLSSYLEWFFGEVLIDAVARNVKWGEASWKVLDDAAAKGKPGSQIEGAFDGATEGVAQLFYRARVDARPEREGQDMRVGDMYVGGEPGEVLAVITPECDLVARPPHGRRSAPRLTLVVGKLNPLCGPDTSVADFLIHDGAMSNVTWNVKDIRTVEYRDVGKEGGYRLIGTLRPLYAYELQRRVLNELGRVGLAVAPAMAVNAKAVVVVRGKDGPIRLEPGANNDASCTVIPKRGGSDRPRIVYRRSFANEILTLLASNGANVHDSAKGEMKALLKPEQGIAFMEKLCRTGQQDGELAYGVLSTLGPEVAGTKAPWCQIVVSMKQRVGDVVDTPTNE